YMLQDTEYRFKRYLSWVHRTKDFTHVVRRRKLDMTPKVILLLIVLRGLSFLLAVTVAVFIYQGIQTDDYMWYVAAAVLTLIAPFILSHGIVVPLFIGWMIIQKPREE